MKMADFDFSEVLVETTAWGRKGKKVVRKVRCSSGLRAGRLVNNAADCNKTKDMKRSVTLKRTKARKGVRMSKKANKTKRTNYAVKRNRAMNARSDR